MKRFLLSVFLLLPLLCGADAVTDVLMVQKASNDFNRNLVSFNKKDDECRASASVLPGNTFQGMGLNRDQ